MSENIVYQNKDVVSKALGENLKEKSFAVYGLNVPRIKEVLPTNLPVVEANELRLDNIFLLEDGSLALVDYESTYTESDKIKYMNYIIRTLKRYTEDKALKDKVRGTIRMIVIYTADIKPGETKPKLDIGCLKFEVEEAFLVELDSEGIEKELSDKIRRKEPLTQDEQMKLLILPLTHSGKEEKQECIRRCFELAKDIEDEKTQVFVMAGMLAFADKVITKEDSKKVREWLMMTKVAQIFEEEKLEYAEKVAKETAEKVNKETAKGMLKKGFSVEDILEILPTLTRKDIAKLMK